MTDIDWSKRRGVADEARWNLFVPTVGGELIAPKINRVGAKKADYMFPDAKVIIEHKILLTEFAHKKNVLDKVDALVAKYPDVDPEDPAKPLHQDLLRLLVNPLQQIVNSANRQIKETKIELGLTDWKGILLCVNDGFRGVPPGFVLRILSHILSKTFYSNTNALIYVTNHFVEVPDSPYAALYWHPLYSAEAAEPGSVLPEFVNDLGRKWREFSAANGGPADYSEERDHVDVSQMSVITGLKRQRPYFDD